jgi:type II secretory pathway component PulJ
MMMMMTTTMQKDLRYVRRYRWIFTSLQVLFLTVPTQRQNGIWDRQHTMCNKIFLRKENKVIARTESSFSQIDQSPQGKFALC